MFSKQKLKSACLAVIPFVVILAANAASARECGYDDCVPAPEAYYGGYTYHLPGLVSEACCGASGVYYPDYAYDWGYGFDYAAGKPASYNALTGLPPNFAPPRPLWKPPVCLRLVPTVPARWAWRRHAHHAWRRTCCLR